VKNFLSQNELSLDEFNVQPSAIAQLINLIDKGTISFGIASQKLFPELITNPSLSIENFIEEKGLKLQTSEPQIDLLIQTALEKHSQKITEYKKGKKGLISLFVGEVMKLSKGSADAKLVTEKIIEKLKT
jgi:aspartyl-tRNA(Asn)/glutamyl-tRNA(Gln) amidotransferase subunit B